ncbi:hypothetical protein RJZ90_006477 [Blastomyces dermatitidis]
MDENFAEELRSTCLTPPTSCQPISDSGCMPPVEPTWHRNDHERVPRPNHVGLGILKQPRRVRLIGSRELGHEETKSLLETGILVKWAGQCLLGLDGQSDAVRMGHSDCAVEK